MQLRPTLKIVEFVAEPPAWDEHDRPVSTQAAVCASWREVRRLLEQHPELWARIRTDVTWHRGTLPKHLRDLTWCTRNVRLVGGERRFDLYVTVSGFVPDPPRRHGLADSAVSYAARRALNSDAAV